MKDWIVDEFYIFIQATSRRPSILWVPTITMILGLILLVFLNVILANYLENNADSMFRPAVEKFYQKQFHRAEYLAFVIPMIEFVRRYWKARKHYR